MQTAGRVARPENGSPDKVPSSEELRSDHQPPQSSCSPHPNQPFGAYKGVLFSCGLQRGPWAREVTLRGQLPLYGESPWCRAQAKLITHTWM